MMLVVLLLRHDDDDDEEEEVVLVEEEAEDVLCPSREISHSPLHVNLADRLAAERTYFHPNQAPLGMVLFRFLVGLVVKQSSGPFHKHPCFAKLSTCLS